MKMFTSMLTKMLMVPLVFLPGPPLLVCAQTWLQTSAPITNWSSIAGSADGARMAAAISKGPIYLSIDSGLSWVASSAPIADWCSIASSADGRTLAALANGTGWVYTSTNFGQTWLLSSSIPEPQPSLVLSADGTMIALLSKATLLGAQLNVSADTGKLWSSKTVPFRTYFLSCSAGGTTLAATYNGIRTSSDLGETWQGVPSAVHHYRKVVFSSDCSTVLAPGYPMSDFGVYFSTNKGLTWASADLPGTVGLWDAAMSADGGKLLAFALASGPALYTSTNSGATWVEGPPPPTNSSAFAVSADASKIAACVTGGGIYILQTTPKPQLGIASAGAAVTISWLIPSIPFALEQSPSPAVGPWREVSEPAALNCSNLHCEVSIPPGRDPMFYRLSSR